MPAFHEGEVWLVGAGPGDPGLMSLYAIYAIQNADVIIYDALVDENCLSLKAQKAKLEFVGKRGGVKSPKQPEITRKIIDYAKQGLKVLRLKGGDPFIFGRGGEEAITLAHKKIKFRIVPGVTAGIGGLAYAGIPATHREINQSVLFLTGHDEKGQLSNRIDWEAVVKAAPVIVMYMATRPFEQIQKHLLNNGRSENESIAFVMHATTKKQKVVISSLGNAIEDMQKYDVKSPAIIVVGEVVDLRPILNWMDDQEIHANESYHG